MGFPNIDIFLVKTILAKLKAFQGEENYRLEEIFDDLDAAEIADIRQFLAGATTTKNTRDRGGRRIYVLPHYPQAEIPFPQIGVSLGNEDTADRFLGDDTGGEAEPVLDDDENVIAHDLQKGYWGSGLWMIQIMAHTKDEVIWLSRLCQQALVDSFAALAEMGLLEVSLSLADLRPDPQYYPEFVFLRGVKVIAGKVANTWKKRIPASFYQTGVNLAVVQP